MQDGLFPSTDSKKRESKAQQKTLTNFVKLTKKQNPEVQQESKESQEPQNTEALGQSSMPQCTIWSWNVNGIRAVIKDGTFAAFMEKAAPKILCLNETKIDSHALEKDGVK